ncbi:MAG: PAS domain-containing protein [Polyangiaceae bacterium]|nr:PAS domain-containing protein [Polyangiaceae bacterium]
MSTPNKRPPSGRGLAEVSNMSEIEWLRHRVATLEAELAQSRAQLQELDELRSRTFAMSAELERLRETRAGGAISGFLPAIERPRESAPFLRSPTPAAPAAPAASAASVAPPMQTPDQGIDFGAIAALSPEKLDDLPYGLITLDATGRVIHYNDTESRLVGLPKERVIGRNFFQEIAPCTRLREFEGRFRELVQDPVRVRVKTFDFVFRFAKGDQHVTVVITPSRVRGRFHMALLRRAVEA